MQEIRPDISEEKSEKQNDYPAGDNSEAGAVKPVSESDKINSIRDALNKIAQKEEEEEILDRITENVKYVKDRKDNREKYELEERMEVNLAVRRRRKRKKASARKVHRKRKKKYSGGVIPRKGDNFSEILRKSVFWLSACVFICCLIWLGTELYNRYETNQKYEDIVSQYKSSLSENNKNEGKTESDNEIKADEEIPTEDTTYKMLPGAENLLELSPDVVGYITIPDTEINYPVMQNKDDDEGEEYFLQHDFYGNSSHLGSIFLDFRCNFDNVGSDGYLKVPTSDNLIVYGHNMKDGSMFGGLRKYREIDGYYEKHPLIEVNSNYKKYTFKIYGYFIADATDTTDTRFEYWNYIDFQNEEDFYKYVNEIKRRTLRLTDVDVKYGDRLLTLSTCSSAVNNGRLVVCARMLREGEDPYDGVYGSKPNPNIKWPTIHKDSSKYDPDADFVPYG
ncbi:MAG: class B sortase [Oscillospiraceae bacterium]|nr:class B sortase [Oscillospiraceae bacterium]